VQCARHAANCSAVHETCAHGSVGGVTGDSWDTVGATALASA
jgi:hypothetical protein